MTQAVSRVSVAGGGVAGLSVARALAQRGVSVRLSEQAPEIGEVGAGLQVSPNGMRVIEALGLGAALRDVALRASAVVLRDGLTGAEVLSLDLSRGETGYYLIHRARLIEVLEAGAREAGVEISLGSQAVPGQGDGFEIGADGWRSAFRPALNGREVPFFTGQVAWRAVIADPSAADVVEVFMGPGRHLVSYPLAAGLRNIVAVEERATWAEAGWHHRDDPAAVRAAFSAFGGPVAEWLAEVEEVFLWGLFRHHVARRWQNGEMAILGDAAHPTLPFLAQGANMALEDAWLLAAALGSDDPAAALVAYEAHRAPRVRRAIAAAEANARNYHLSGPARVLGHSALRLAGRVAPGLALQRLGWLYDFDVTSQNVT